MIVFQFRSLTTLCLLLILAVTAAGQPLRTVYFEEVLAQRVPTSGQVWNSQRFCPTETNVVARRVLESYGSMFVASDGVKIPPVCVFDSEAAVLRFQKTLSVEVVPMLVPISMQTRAAQALRRAIEEATAAGFRITPLDGAIAGGRTYGDTLMLWNSRVFPALGYWSRLRRLSPTDLDEFAKLELAAKIRKILEWEQRGIYFSTDRSRSIMTSTAPPGASQHLSLLAFDIVEYWNRDVAAILNSNGWYQTIVDDAPHFTYLGFPETELPARGLRMVAKGGHNFWVPNLASKPNLITD